MTSDDSIEKDKIFSDKLKKERILFDYELKMVSQFESIVRRLSTEEVIESDLERDGEYFLCWQMAATLYRIFEHNEKVQAKLKKANKEQHCKIKDIIVKYRKLEAVTFSELQILIDQLVRMMELSGFHDVSTSKGRDRDFLKPTQAW